MRGGCRKVANLSAVPQPRPRGLSSAHFLRADWCALLYHFHMTPHRQSRAGYSPLANWVTRHWADLPPGPSSHVCFRRSPSHTYNPPPPFLQSCTPSPPSPHPPILHLLPLLPPPPFLPASPLPRTSRSEGKEKGRES
jgi:hypothetical protein